MPIAFESKPVGKSVIILAAAGKALTNWTMPRGLLQFARTRCCCALWALLLPMLASDASAAASTRNGTPPTVNAVSQALLAGDESAVAVARTLRPLELTAVADQITGTLGVDSATDSMALRALELLVADGGGLPDGAPRALLRALQTMADVPSSSPLSVRASTSKILGRLTSIAIRADGVQRLQQRVRELSEQGGSVYTWEAIRGITNALSVDGSMSKRNGATQWTAAEAIEAIAILTEYSLDRLESATRTPLIEARMESISSFMMMLSSFVTEQILIERARPIAACAYARLFDAMYGLYDEKTGAAPPGWWYTMPSRFVSLSALTGVPFPRLSQEVFNDFERGLKALANVGDHAMTAERLSQIILLLDDIATGIGELNAMANLRKGADELVTTNGICESCAHLVSRISSIKPDDPAWTLVNRCLWIAAVDRDRSKNGEAECGAIRGAWAEAKGALPTAWREECAQRKPDAAVDGAAVDKQPAAPPVPATPQ